MPAKILILYIVSLCPLPFAATPQPKEQGRTTTAKPRTPSRARAKITAQNSEAQAYDQTTSPALMELRLNETFTRDLDGESPVRALQVLRGDHSASLVSVQRFCGKLGGRQGTFVLQGQETVENGGIKATWFVVPGSGTGELSGLRGKGGFTGDFGKGSDGALDYLVRMRCFGFNSLFYTALSQSQRKEILSKNGAQRNVLTTVSMPAAGAFNKRP